MSKLILINNDVITGKIKRGQGGYFITMKTGKFFFMDEVIEKVEE